MTQLRTGAAGLSNYLRFVAPVLRQLDPEFAHNAAIRYLRYIPSRGGNAIDDPRLRQTIWGLEFPHPIGLAAGFDKNAEVPDAVIRRGAAFAEVGTVTPRPQPGNPKPRLFRLTEDGAVINRLGFNNQGLDAFAARLAARRRGGIVGANVGKNRDSDDAVGDYVLGIERLAALADYLVVNVSSPNTPGLRDLQGAPELRALIIAANEARTRATPDNPPPLLVKIAPDLSEGQLADIAEIALELSLDGLIATNTTIERPAGLMSRHVSETGGLSGRPLLQPATKILSNLYRLTEGKLPLIGVGGVETADDAYAKIRAGASLVQLYSAMTDQGLGIFPGMARGLADRLQADGYENITDAVGADHR